jgi:hypothetical protein
MPKETLKESPSCICAGGESSGETLREYAVETVKVVVAFSAFATSINVRVWFPDVADGTVNETFTSFPTALAFESKVRLSQSTWNVPFVVVMLPTSCMVVPTFPLAGVREITAVAALTSSKSERPTKADVRMSSKHTRDPAFLYGSFVKRLPS